jgi:DNA polymerase III alpha subunit
MHETFALEQQIKTVQNFPLEEICRMEYETFNYMVTRHPLHFYKDLFDDSSVIKANEMVKYKGKYVTMIGWYMTSKRIKTKKGDIMKFLSLEDLYGTFEAVIFPKVYYEYAELTMSMGPYIVEGIVDKNDPANLVVRKMSLVSSLKVLRDTEKDSVDNKYYGDIEKVYEEEFMMLKDVNKEKLRLAYAG